MILAVFRVMLLGLLRDRAALAMAFALPPIIYVIFAAIFSVTAGGDLKLKIAVLDQVHSQTTQRLMKALAKSPDSRLSQTEPKTIKDIEDMVRKAEIDAGIVIRFDPTSLNAHQDAPILIVSDPARAIAAPIVTGRLLSVFNEYLPDIIYGRSIEDFESKFFKLLRPQREGVNNALESIKKEVEQKERQSQHYKSDKINQLVEQKNILIRNQVSATVVYYAGAVGFMFLLFSLIQGAMSLIDERQNGIIDRMVSGIGSVGKILTGKFLFLVFQGVIQLSLIFFLAQFFYGVDVVGKWRECLFISIGATCCAASIGLVIAALFKTRQQATTFSNFFVLVMSAIGGSMVPRFLMPPWLQEMSWFAPSAWVIESYNAALWQGAGLSDLALSISLLMIISVMGFIAAMLSLNNSIQN
jgi:ABC-2 type transport system permease protein